MDSNLHFTDIADALKSIDHACNEGAYRGWNTIRQVLALRDKLQAFVDAAQVEIEAQQKAKEMEVVDSND